MNCRRLLADLTPPALLRWLRYLYARPITFSGDYPDWAAALGGATGYDTTEILERVRSASHLARDGKVAYERDSVTFMEPAIAPELFGMLFLAAIRTDGRLNVLDFGGSLGSLYFQHRRFLQNLKSIRWNVVEQSHFVDSGRAEFEDDILRFYKTLEDCLAENEPDVLVLSGVLQYLPDPHGVLARLTSIRSASYLLIDRTPISDLGRDILTVQKVPPAIYTASYPMWIFSGASLAAGLATDWKRFHLDLSLDGSHFTRSGIPFRFECWMLERKAGEG